MNILREIRDIKKKCLFDSTNCWLYVNLQFCNF